MFKIFSSLLVLLSLSSVAYSCEVFEEPEPYQIYSSDGRLLSSEAYNPVRYENYIQANVMTNHGIKTKNFASTCVIKSLTGTILIRHDESGLPVNF